MNKVKIIKIASIVMSVAGMVGSAWASDQENKANLAKLVAQTIGK